MITSDALEAIRISDEWLDAKVSKPYKSQPLAQDWARVAKVSEELGEAVDQLILYTGQNPRKSTDTSALSAMLGELADTALTAILAIQHFVKNPATTEWYMKEALAKIEGRTRN